MPISVDVAAALTLVLVLALLFAEWRSSLTGRWIAKPLASAGFVATALLAGATRTSHGTVVLAALALCAVGDVLLIPSSRTTFRLGLASFLLGHLGFAAAFVRGGIDWRYATAAALVACALAVIVGRWLLPHVERAMRPPVIAYIVVISSMVALAVGSFAAHGRALPLVAALAFYASDLAVARDTFVHKAFVNRLWGLPLYYGAVLLFALSVGSAR